MQLCPQCKTAVFFSDQGLQAIPVTYGAPEAGASAAEWYPFWLLPARVEITSRSVQSGNRTDAEMAQRFWAEQRPMFVPAWDLPARAARELGSRMLHEKPAYRAIDRPESAGMHVATIDPDDARKLLEFIIVTVEANRRDWLRDLQFQVEVGTPQLWALPMQEDNGSWQVVAAIEKDTESE